MKSNPNPAATESTPAPATSSWRSLLASSRDFLPWLVLIANLIYSFGLKQSTNDRTQQQSQEDHIAIQEMRSQLSDLGKQEAVLATKVDLLISGTFKVHRDGQ